MYVCLYVCIYVMHACMYCVCMYVYVCMYACMHVCMYACMHVCMTCMYAWHACMHVCMYACMHVCMYACMHVCMYACMHACMYACMHVCMYACNACMHVMHVCMYACNACMHACMHVCMYVCMYVCKQCPISLCPLLYIICSNGSAGQVSVHFKEVDRQPVHSVQMVKGLFITSPQHNIAEHLPLDFKSCTSPISSCISMSLSLAHLGSQLVATCRKLERAFQASGASASRLRRGHSQSPLWKVLANPELRTL